MVKVLFDPAVGLELPPAVVATRVNDPTAVEESVRVIIADVPPAPIETFEIAAAGGTKAGTNENVAPVKLTPVTWKGLIVAPWSPDVGLMEVITGTGRTAKFVVVVAVDPPTVTEMGPVVAPEGTVTVRELVVAAVTVATVPLNLTVSLAGVALKACPWIVTVVPMPPCAGVKLKMASVVPEPMLEVVMETMFPMAS